jgi:hypothetical protein
MCRIVDRVIIHGPLRESDLRRAEELAKGLEERVRQLRESR